MAKLNKEQLYYAIFFQLDRYCELNKEKLKESFFPGLVSAMDPFLFKGLRSADPAMYIEFEECYKRTFENRLTNYTEGFEFIQTYLNLYEGVYECNSEYIFSQMSRTDWYKCCDYAIEFLKENRR